MYEDIEWTFDNIWRRELFTQQYMVGESSLWPLFRCNVDDYPIIITSGDIIITYVNRTLLIAGNCDTT